MEDKQLIKFKENIITKIKIFIYKVFYKKERKVIPNLTDNTPRNQIEKEKALNFYIQLKENKITINDIPIDYLDIIKEFFIKEIDIKTNKINQVETEIAIISYKINNIKQ